MMFIKCILGWILFMLFSLCASTFASQSSNLHLRHVNLVWRHGARSPTRTYPNDPYNNKPIWPQGPGQLTQIGMKQHYEFGTYLRTRYNHLLSSNYNRTEIYIRSTDFDRTLMSAESNLAGLYPPQGKQKWNGSDTTWQPIPIHTVPQKDDHLLIYLKNCPKYNKIQQEIFNSDYYKMVDKYYREFLSEIKILSGFKTELNISDSWTIEDPLICEKTEKLSLPDWVTAARFDKLHTLAGYDLGFLFGADTRYRTAVAQIGAGYLVKQIIENMEHNIDQSRSYKVNVYSAHDTTLVGLLVALDTYTMHPPPFASSLMFELYEDQSENAIDKFVVKAFYRNSTTEPPIALSLLGCDLNCPLSELKRRAEPLLPVTEKPDCDVANSSLHIDFVLLFSIAIAVTVLITFILVVILLRMKKKRRKTLAYHSLNPNEEDI